MSRRGTVVRATPATFAGLEKAGRRQNAKGVYIERGPHTKAVQIQTWLNGQEEEDLMFGEFASAQLLVAKPNEECDDSDCDEDHDEDHGELATEEDVEAALDQLVSELPASFRTHVRDDAAALVRLSRRLSPATPWITLRLEILHQEACWRWHQDGYCGRTLVCYVGPGQRLGAEMNLNASRGNLRSAQARSRPTTSRSTGRPSRRPWARRTTSTSWRLATRYRRTLFY